MLDLVFCSKYVLSKAEVKQFHVSRNGKITFKHTLLRPQTHSHTLPLTQTSSSYKLEHNLFGQQIKPHFCTDVSEHMRSLHSFWLFCTERFTHMILLKLLRVKH